MLPVGGWLPQRVPEALKPVGQDLSFKGQDVRLVRSHAGQEVGDECAGHDDGLSLVGDNGGEVAGRQLRRRANATANAAISAEATPPTAPIGPVNEG